ncbi:craniofacial development protein 1 isoform X3 [Arachis ipaensis]|uniref:craniofacial development protein 1 isoform X3 n=1 Tax=Arachis ipaensis TaxID=130454 RepID=UPI000A2B34EE|nr:craniofacial development protein 1 isoform X3 [Arachis ipaensis]XP_020969952.1 craniofacial development protein 1 isoform X3 [Arachis ipaensis]XP_025686045.1 craniofacial development protein 1 isoform X4 [Arachis hypogaea]XP_025686046.1 craniofacial development protein 1 isoform X4 [Arachis hypogaea]
MSSADTINANSAESVKESVPGTSLETQQDDTIVLVLIEIKAQVDAMWGQMKKGVSNDILRSFASKSNSTPKRTAKKGAFNCLSYLGLAPKATESVGQAATRNGTVMEQSNTNDEAKKLAAAALAAVKDDAAASSSSKGKLVITEVRDFAGQDIEVKKLLDSDSKEAMERAKIAAPSAVDAVLEQIKKKQKLSVLDKTKMDWGEFKEENKLEGELDAYKRSSDQYLDKVSFLQRTDYREFERERDARLALQARKRTDMREEPYD